MAFPRPTTKAVVGGILVAVIAGLTFQVYQRLNFGKESANLARFEYTRISMGMPVTLTVYAPDRTRAETACKAAFARIVELENVFSDYIRDSQTSTINRADVGQPVPVSPEMVEVLEFSQQLHNRSGGVFDPAAGVVIQLWRESRKTGQLPTPKERESAIARTGIGQLAIRGAEPGHESQATVTRLAPVQLDFGGIAKGYVGDAAIDCLAEHGIDRACFEAGGDLVCSGPPPQESGWPVELPDHSTRHIANAAIAVSGDTVQSVTIDGTTYSHVVDVRTGLGVQSHQLSIVSAPRGMVADALATTGCVLTPKAFQSLLEKYPAAQGEILSSP